MSYFHSSPKKRHSLGTAHPTFLATCVALLILIVPLAKGVTIYVNPVTGGDAPGWGTSDHPYRTIGYAIAASTDGDLIIAQAGTYTGSGNTNLSFQGKNIEVRGVGAPGTWLTVIDCGGADNRAFKFVNNESRWARVANLRIHMEGSQATSIHQPCI